MPNDRNSDVLIAGGGLAGLAAASVLAPRGFHVTLLESRNRLGGRASSFVDPESDELVDNCQHVSMGCCTNLADFCRRLGLAPLLSQHRVLYFQNERGRVSKLRAAPLPAPLHLAPSFLTAEFLSFTEKFRIAYALICLMRQPVTDRSSSFADWLRAHGQTERTCERFWGLVLTSALNESLEHADYRYARQVFVEGFLSAAAAGIVEIPLVPLGEFYGKRLEDWLRYAGVAVETSTAACRVVIENDAARAVIARDGRKYQAAYYILALPYPRLCELFADVPGAMAKTVADLQQLGDSPITSVHLWYDRPVMDYPHIVPVGRTVQWLFRKQWSTDANPDEVPAGAGEYIQAVISASRELAAAGKQRVFELIEAEVRAILPRAADATLLRHRVVTDKAATYSIEPGIDRLRPAQETAIANLWLAGDYTRTGWPATMEGAVRSGYLAAQSILTYAGKPEVILKPPLKPGLLARWLIKRCDPDDAP